MEKINKYYECLFVVDVTDGDEAVKATVEKFVGIINANAETVVEVAQWGKRRLAYPINDKPEGYYVVATFKSAPEFPCELERLLNIDESIMRQVTTRLDFTPVAKAVAPAEEVAPADEESAPTEEVAPEAPAAEAAAEAPVAGGYGQRSLCTSPAQAAERPDVSERYPAAVHRNRQPSGKEKPYVS